MGERICSVEGCNKPRHAHGYCNMHAQRVKRHGDPGGVLPEFIVGDDEARFWAKVNKSGPVPETRSDLGSCWEWTASTGIYGYGQFNPGGNRGVVQAYRWGWTRFVGPVPNGMELDHLCRNPLCVNYESHLEVVTKTENILRGECPMAINARKTHCLRGHPLTGDNVYQRKDRNGRECIACRNERRRKK